MIYRLKKFNLPVRLIASVVSLVMIMGTAMISVVSADNSTPKFTQENGAVDANYIADMGKNILLGKTPKVYATLGSNTREVVEGASASIDNYFTICPSSLSSNWGGMSVMTDGEMFTKNNNKKNCQIVSQAYKTAEQYNNYSVKLIYDLENVYNIDKLLFVSWLAGKDDQRVQEYEFYISESAGTAAKLFTDENKVTDSPTLCDYDLNNPSTVAQAFTASEAVSGRYVGIKLIKGDPKLEKFQFIISELGVYGDRVYPFRQETENVDSDYIADMGDNLLSGKTPKVYATLGLNTREVVEGDSASAGNYFTICPPSAAWGGMSVMTDGEMLVKNNKTDCQIVSQAYKTADQYNNYSVKLIYDLGDVYNIDKLLFVSRLAGKDDQRVQEYEFYVSESAGTAAKLFTDANKVSDSPTLCEYDKDKDYTVAQAFTTSEVVSGRYVGIKLIKGDPTWEKFRFFISELGVYGTEPEAPPTVEVITDDIDANYVKGLGTNLINGKSPKIIASIDDKIVYITETKDGNGPGNYSTFFTKCPGSSTGGWGGSANLTDGVLYSTSNSMNMHINGPQTASYPSYYAGLIFDLEDYYELDKFLLVSGWRTYGDVALQEYEIYVGDSEASIFSSENLVVSYDNRGKWDGDATTHAGAAQLFKFNPDPETNTKPEGHYVGLKILAAHGTASNFIAILDEIGIYGTYMPDYNTDSNLTADQVNVLGQNILTGYTPSYLLTTSETSSELSADKVSGDSSVLTDSKIYGTSGSERVQLTGQSNGKIDIVYSLSKKCQIQKLMIAGASENSGISNYEIYVSKRLDTLFNESNLKLSYKNENGSGSQLFTFLRKSKPVGKYIGIRIASETADISEIGVYGIDNYSDNVNLLSGKPMSAYLTDNSGKVSYVGDLTATERENLTNDITNGLDSDEISVTTGGKQLDLVYDIGKTASIDELSLYSAYLNGSGEVKKLNIYVADTEENVWKDVNKVYSGENEGNCFVYELFPAISGRYVRFSVLEHEGTVCRLGELGAYGAKNQATTVIDLLNVRNTFEITGWEFDKANTATELYPFPQKSNETITAITDDDASTSMNLSASSAGKTVDLLVKFSSVNVFSRFAFILKNDFKGQVKFYVGDSKDAVFAASAVPAAQYSCQTASSDMIQLAVSTVQGRYVRISFAGNSASVKTSVDIAKLAVIGFSLETVSDKYFLDTAATLLDTDSGIRVDILKDNGYDLYTQATELRVSYKDITAAQQALIGDYGFDIIDNVVTIELYDRVGNKITDLGGRNIQIYIPMPVGLIGDVAYLCEVEKDDIEFKNAAYENTRMYFTVKGKCEISYVLTTAE